jgi:hypothetical protein
MLGISIQLFGRGLSYIHVNKYILFIYWTSNYVLKSVRFENFENEYVMAVKMVMLDLRLL